MNCNIGTVIVSWLPWFWPGGLHDEGRQGMRAGLSGIARKHSMESIRVINGAIYRSGPLWPGGSWPKPTMHSRRIPML